MTILNTDFRATLEDRKEKTYVRLDELNQRITDLDVKFEEEKIAILKYVDDRGEELTKLLNQFKVFYTLPAVVDSFLTVLCYSRLNSTRIDDYD